VEWIAHSSPNPSLLLTDDNPALWGRMISGFVVASPEEVLHRREGKALCAIGDNSIRWEVLLRLRSCGFEWGGWRHGTVTLAPSVVIGSASILMPHAVLDVESHVGQGCLINTAAIISHHCTLGDAVHLAPGVRLGGGVYIGDGAFLGLGAIVLPGVRIGRNAVVGAGTVVRRDVEEGSVVAGNPARLLHK
jgi:sugar O-acyltransferase (sialic acid O-acetyltransferase NeuD family)